MIGTRIWYDRARSQTKFGPIPRRSLENSFFIIALNRTNYNLLNEEKSMMFYGYKTNILEENIVHYE
jgi:hypothetical protein